MLTKEEKIEIVNLSLRDMIDPRPYSQIINDDCFVRIITKTDYSFFRNSVYWSVLDDDDIDEKIEKIIADYKEHDLSFRWVVGPGSEPKELVDMLVFHGFQKVPNGFPGAGMIGTYHSMNIQSTVPFQGEYEMQIVAGSDQIDSFVGIMETCFRYTVDNEKFLKIAIHDDVFAQPRRLWYFLVCYRHEPIGILGARIYDDGFAYLSAGAVLPEYRRKGALKYLAKNVIGFLKDMGINTYTTQTLPHTSENLCANFGFETVCQVDTLLYLLDS